MSRPRQVTAMLGPFKMRPENVEDLASAVERAPAVAGYRSDGLEDAGTRWTLNGSTLVLTVDGDVWTFRYLEPRQGLVEEGVCRGTLLFKGHEDETGLVGTAYRFSKRCGARAYEVRVNQPSVETGVYTEKASPQANPMDNSSRELQVSIHFKY